MSPKLSNGPTEAVNLLVKKVERAGHGFRNFENYRLRLLLHCGVEWDTAPTARMRGRRPPFIAWSPQVNEVAKQMVSEAMQSTGRVAGFGIPAYHADPRAPALLKVAQETGAAGPYCRLLVAMEQELALAKGRPIPISLDGIVAALVLDFGFPMGSSAGFVMIPRSFSTLAHHLEEKSQGTRWRYVPQEHVTYTGPVPVD